MIIEVQVQHRSNHDRDGRWYPLERVPHPATDKVEAFLSERADVFRKSYGRPVRIIEVQS